MSPPAAPVVASKPTESAESRLDAMDPTTTQEEEEEDFSAAASEAEKKFLAEQLAAKRSGKPMPEKIIA
jgi:hypothetical protein